MLSKLIWLSFWITSLYSARSLVKCQENELPLSDLSDTQMLMLKLYNEERPLQAVKEADGNKTDENSVIAFLDDYKVLPIQSEEIKNITCKGDHCDKVELKEPSKGNLAFTFSLAEPLPDTLIGTYNLVCRNIKDNDKRKCGIELEITEKEKKEEGGEEGGEKEDSKKHLPFIFGFLGGEILLVLVLLIAFGLNGKGPMKQFLRPDRSPANVQQPSIPVLDLGTFRVGADLCSDAEFSNVANLK